MYRISLDEALSQRPKTVGFLQRIRKTYERQMDKMSEEKLVNLRTFFDNKEVEAMSHKLILEENRMRYPKLITDELLASKDMLILFWRGLKEEADKRLG